MVEIRLLRRPLLLGVPGEMKHDFHSISKTEYRALYFYNSDRNRNHHYRPHYPGRYGDDGWHFYGQTFTELR